MNSPHAEKDGHDDHADGQKEAKQKKLAILNLFRLLETAVQTTQLKVAGQVVVPVQEIVGSIMSAKTEFEGDRHDDTLQGLRQAAEAYRYKTVRWESEARAAQAGQRQLAEGQKRQLPAEISAVRTTARKTQMFFDRLLAALAEWARAAEAEQDGSSPGGARLPGDTGVRDGFALRGETEADEDGFTLSFSLTPMKQFVVDVIDIRKANKLELTFHNSSQATADIQVQVFNAAEDPILKRPEGLQLPATSEESVERYLIDMAVKIDPKVKDTRAASVELINVPDDVAIAHVAFKLP